jgi:hypothetical protein
VSTDLNDDGYLDLVIVQTVVDPAASIYYRGGRIQILINQQGKGFQDETAQRGSPGFDTFNNYDSYHGTLTVFDINGDGAMDLIAVRTTLGRYENHIFLNDGNGSFTRAEVQGLPSMDSSFHYLIGRTSQLGSDISTQSQTDWYRRPGERSEHARWQFRPTSLQYRRVQL